MKSLTWFVTFVVFPFTIGYLFSCSAEKRVLKDTDKTQHVVAEWLKKQTFKADTVVRFLPGDTTTTLLVNYDTTTVKDTVTNIVEKTVTKTKTITNTIHDTVKVSVKCADGSDPCALLKGCQDALQNNSIVLEEHRIGEQNQKLRADKWVFRFWIMVVAIILVVAAWVYLKFKP
jgi:GTP cyclohydrolase III